MKEVKCFVFVLLMIVLPADLLADRAKVQIVVLDEQNAAPLKGVPVGASFLASMDFIYGEDPDKDRGITCTDGTCRLSGNTKLGKVGCYVAKAPNGYYKPNGGELFSFSNKNFFGTWQPDNLVVTLKLQRVMNPIPLFVKKRGGICLNDETRDVFSKETNKASYDLMSGDWLPPMGTGVVADVVFTRLPREILGMTKRPSGKMGEMYRDYMLTTFDGEGNGLVEESVPKGLGLKIRTAPELGYKREWRCWQGKGMGRQNDTNFDENRCFTFRIRTKRNEKGEIVEAYYGKIYGDIRFSWGYASEDKDSEIVSVAVPHFCYYLNPTPLDRNLEWNMQNLCKNPGGLRSPQP